MLLAGGCRQEKGGGPNAHNQHKNARGENSDFELALCVVRKEVCFGGVFFFFWRGVGCDVSLSGFHLRVMVL